MRTKPVFGSRPFGKRDAKLLLIAYFDPNGIETIPQSIEAWQSLSRHEVVLLNLWPGRGGTLRLPASLDLSEFDGLIVHPTISYFPTTVSALDAGLKVPLDRFDGVKVLMKQDEQVLAGLLPELVRDKHFDIVLTCVPPAEQEKVYPRAVIGDCTLQQMLTGYVSPLMRQGMPKGKRDIQVTYRGSIQPLAFGRLGYEKRGVGYDVAAALARFPDIRFDISSRWEDRLSGDAWDSFLSRSGIVLGVESGANLFDYDGSVARWCEGYAERHQGEDVASYAYYRNAHDEFLHHMEGNVNYAQISPRHFEAASAGAAQLLYEGEYSGIFRPEQHFFPLRRDLANLDAAIDFIRDDKAQRRMAKQAFEEIILDRRNWYESFVSSADDAIDVKLAEKGRRLASVRTDKNRPLAYVLAAHDPVIDPRIGWFASSLARTHEVIVIGTYRFGEVGDGPSLENGPDGIKLLRLERTKHDAAWLPSASELRSGRQSVARSLLASLVGYSAAPDAVLQDLLGSQVAVKSELERFRALCTYMVNTNAALLGAIEKLGAPDLVVAADLEALFAAVACKELHGSRAVFDAHEYWPYSYTDFQHWEIEFWSSLEGRLSALADICVAVTPQLAQRMGYEYDVPFRAIPNAATLQEGTTDGMEEAFARRGEERPLRVLYQGGFAVGRGLEEIIRAWTFLKSNAVLVLRGPDNDYRQTLIGFARSLGLDETRVEFPAAVPESQLVRSALEADIGLVPYNPAYFGYRYCCPNKLSQYAAAGLPILTSRTEFVAETVAQNGIGYVVDIADARQVAGIIDSLATKRQELVSIGRRARAFFEKSFNWDTLAAPVLEEIARIVPGGSSGGPDFTWVERPAPQIGRSSRVSLPPPSTVFGGGSVKGSARDLANAELGATIVASSPFHSRPNDADYLLRSEVPGGYAAVLLGAPSPHWVEIDLGSLRRVEAIEIEWFDANTFATDYRILGRTSLKESWFPIAEIEESKNADVRHEFPPRILRHIRLEASKFHGDPRLLVRALRAIEASGPGSPDNTVQSAVSDDDLRLLDVSTVDVPPLDVADAEEGASIRSSSPFHPRPNDADFLLRRGNDGGYAAAFSGSPLPHWIEIDLGRDRIVGHVEIAWFSSEAYPIRYRLVGRPSSERNWKTLVQVEDNAETSATHDLPGLPLRYVRLEASEFHGDPRLLVRAFRVIGATDSTADDDAQPDLADDALRLADGSPIELPPVDVADAEEGASISASSPFHPRPHDADFLLRRGNDGGYAAAFSGSPLPHWIEIDLGRDRIVGHVEIAWFSSEAYPIRYRLVGRPSSGRNWKTLVQVEENAETSATHDLPGLPLRYVRLEASEFHGDPRLLVRAFKMFEASPAMGETSAIEPPAKLENFASASYGATVAGSSAFFEAPYDAAAAIGIRGEQVYASALAEAEKPHWIEVDLGGLRRITCLLLEWYDEDHYARAYKVLGRAGTGDEWIEIAEVQDNAECEVIHQITEHRVRFLRLEASAFAGQDRLILQSFKILGHLDDA